MERDIGVDDEVLPDDELRLVVLGVLVEDDTGECGWEVTRPLVEHGDGDVVRNRLGYEHEPIVAVVEVGVLDWTILDVIGPLVVDSTRQLGEREHGARNVVGVVRSIVNGVNERILVEDGSATEVIG
jgi:hypothetical protein